MRQRLVLLLAVTSGATDATSFLALGGAFTSVMTGNMVLFGTAAGTRDAVLAAHVGAAIVAYITGCLLGARVAGEVRQDDATWPREITRALLIELALFTGFGLVWWYVGGAPSSRVQLLLVIMSAVALGVQSSAVHRFGVSGLSTTYLTGTLTMIVIALARSGRIGAIRPRMQIIGGLVGGALLASIVVDHMEWAVPMTQLFPILAVLVAASIFKRPLALHK
jgi:uncharacterized membrane protein YoaK (UPF0700 family)